MKEWYTPAEIADLQLDGLPSNRTALIRFANSKKWQDRQNLGGQPLARKRKGRGGGWEYHYTVFPDQSQRQLVRKHHKTIKTEEAPALPQGTGERWDWFERQTYKKKQKALGKLQVIQAVNALYRGGLQRDLAVHEIARQEKKTPRTIYNWFNEISGVDEKDWLPYLCPGHMGRTVTAACDPNAWELLKGMYLNQSKRPFETCYDDLKRIAEEKGWAIPASRTLYRRIEKEIPKPVLIYLREGPQKLARMFPAQERDRTGLHAMEAVNVDGHKWDVFVRWPDGAIARPIMVAIQDLYSNKILGWRVDRSENTDLVRLAFKDVFENFGIPDRCLLDNGRAFASKYISGGTPNRYRFKVKEEEPVGLLTALNIQLHWAQPGHGQAKPIERAFGDLCNIIAKHPAFEGAYTGNRPEAKPENYGSKAVDLEDFLRVVEQGMAFYNAKEKRNTRVCARQMSFDQAFERSYAKSLIRKAGDEQLRMFMLAAESVKTHCEDGSIRIMGNRYWAECLHDHIGKSMTVRFDPDNLHDGVHVYRTDGVYIGFVECIEAVGFFDTKSAKDQASKVRAFKKHVKAQAELERELSIGQVADLLAQVEVVEPDAPQPQATRLVLGNTVAKAAQTIETQDLEEIEELRGSDFDMSFRKGLSVVKGGREI